MTTITEQLGRVLANRYRLDAGLGSGTSAHVYAAFDTRLSRRVAIKLVHPGLVDDEGFLRRLRAEARSVASLSHPNILKVFDWGEEEDGPFLVLEYLGGGSLRALLDTGARLDPAQAAAIGLQAAQGLAYAHRRGFVHRDIKPANLLFDEDGSLRIADFGLARALAEAAWTEPAGAMLGTARYASPEQAQGRPLDDRSDVFSLALVLYEAIVGRVPFAADTTLATLMARVGAPLPIVPELGPLAPILGLATISEPLARLDAAEFAENLELLVRQLPDPDPLPLARGELPVLVEPWAVDAMTTSAVPSSPPPPSSEGRDHERAASRPGRPPRPAGEELDREASNQHEARPPRRRHSRTTSPRLYDAADDGEYADDDVVPASAPLRTPEPPFAGRVPRRERRSATRSDRHRVRLILIVVLVLALLAGGAVALARRFVVLGHKVPVLVGKTLAHAQRAAHAADLRLVVGPGQYSSTVPAGTVLSEKPRPGIRLKSDGRITVVLSNGHAPVTVPTVTGKSGAAAVALLRAAKLAPHATFVFNETVPSGSVISESPASGQAAYESQVAIVVSRGPAPRTIPSGLDGGSWTAVQASLTALRLDPSESLVFSSTVASGTVISTAPASGTAGVRVGSPVSVVVSKGPDLVLIPNVHEDTIPQALAALQTAGLDVTEQIGPPGATYATATVPAAGKEVPPGSQITLYAG